MNILDLRKLCNDNTIQVTAHVLKRCRERKITLDDIISCIMNGEIIENYPNDYPYPSALVIGYKKETPIHLVAGIGDGKLWIITAYFPDPNQWDNNFTVRKEH